METLTPEQQIVQVHEDFDKRVQNTPETEPYEHMSRVVEEKIQEHQPNFQASTHLREDKQSGLNDMDQAKVGQWVSEAFSKGIWQSIKEAKDSDQTALLDAFHAALTGELFDKLVASKQLKAVA